MSHAKHGLKALGLCLVAALGVVAVMAASAQAATWLEQGTAITTLLPIVGLKDEKAKVKDWILHSEAIGETKVLILCQTLEVLNGNLHPDGTATATLHFLTCKTELNGAESMVCLPKEPIVSKVKITQYLHKHEILGVKEVNEQFMLFSPADGTLKFTKIELNKEKGCSIGPNFEVTGHAIVLDCEHKPLTDQKEHLIEQVEGTLYDLEGNKNSLSFGKFAAQILGSEIIHLGNNNTWAGHV